MGSKHQARIPSVKHKNGERNPQNSWLLKDGLLKNSRVSVHQGEIAQEADTLLKSQCTKLCLQSLVWAPVEGGQGETEPRGESLGLVAQGRELKSEWPGSLC